MLASELIANAWYTSGIVARQSESVSGAQSADGLRLLNSLLTEFAIDGANVPYYTVASINLVVGQEKYNVPGLIFAESVTFQDGDIRWPMWEDKRKAYFSTGRVNDIQSLPFHYHQERAKGGTDIYLYFLPDKAYQLNIVGKYMLTNVLMSTNLNTGLDNFYINYLEYALAERLCAWYNVDMPSGAAKILLRLNGVISKISTPDLEITTVNMLSSEGSPNWAQLNIGKGWTPS